MKTGLPFLCLLLMSSFLLAQNQCKLQLQEKVAIYYAPNAHELLAEDIKAIDQLLQKNSTNGTFYLQAYTDDKGRAVDNQRLAQKRAQTVRQYLLTKGIGARQIVVKQAVALHTPPSNEVEKKRQAYRRTTIAYWSPKAAPSPLTESVPTKKVAPIVEEVEAKVTNLKTIFDQFEKKAKQQLTIDPTKWQIVEGKAGTYLQIPPNSFVDAEGQPVEGEVTLYLQEAYTIRDMIAQNLSTTSKGEILESGGMFKIEAKDATGKQVQLAAGKTITASLPSKEASLPGMQSFYGRKHDNGQTDWEPSSVAVKTTNSEQMDYYYQPTPYIKDAFGDIMLPKVASIQSIERFPRWIEQPRLEARMPRRPRLVNMSKPDRTHLETVFFQRKNESDANYDKRITQKLRQLNKEYYKSRSKDQQKVYAFQRDSMTFERKKATYEKKLAAHQACKAEIRAILKEIYQKTSKLSAEDYYQNLALKQVAFKELKEKCKNMKKAKEVYQKALSQMESQGHNVYNLVNKLEGLALDSLLKGVSRQLDGLYGKRSIQETDYYKKQLRKKISAFRSVKNRARSINRRIDKQRITEKRHKQVRELYQDFKWSRLVRSTAREEQKVKDKLPYIKRYLAANESLQAIQEDYFEMLKAFGLLDSRLLMNEYTNVMQINQLGWINCDRFYQDPAPKVNCNILVENGTEDTRFFLVFDGIKSVMRGWADYQGRGFVFNNIPTNRSVELIGLRVVGGEVQVFRKRGKATTFRKFQATFRSVGSEEVMDLLAQQ